MTENKFGIVEEIFTKADIQKHQRPLIKDFCQNLTQIREFYKNIVNDTLDIRKRIYQGMENFDNLIQSFLKNFNLDQLGKFIECTRNIRCRYKIGTFEMWDIKRASDYQNNKGDLTDSDEELDSK